MSGFARTLVYGAFASAALPLAVLTLSPALGMASALGLYAVFVVAGYLAALTPAVEGRGIGKGDARRRVAVACGSLGTGLAAWALSESVSQLFVLLSLAVGLVRSGLVFQLFQRRDSLRAVVIEGGVLVGALLAARFLAAPGLVGSAVALWGWFVVQSFAFLLIGIPRRSRVAGGDPFEVARRRLEELLGT
jgi:hypothetical protein